MKSYQTENISQDELDKIAGIPTINYTWSDGESQPCYQKCLSVDETNMLDVRWKLMKNREHYYLYDEHKAQDVEALELNNIPFEVAPDGAILIDDTYSPFLAKLSIERELLHNSAYNIFINNCLYVENGKSSFTDPDVVERVMAVVMDRTPKFDIYTTTINQILA